MELEKPYKPSNKLFRYRGDSIIGLVHQVLYVQSMSISVMVSNSNGIQLFRPTLMKREDMLEKEKFKIYIVERLFVFFKFLHSFSVFIL